MENMANPEKKLVVQFPVVIINVSLKLKEPESMLSLKESKQKKNSPEDVNNRAKARTQTHLMTLLSNLLYEAMERSPPTPMPKE